MSYRQATASHVGSLSFPRSSGSDSLKPQKLTNTSSGPRSHGSSRMYHSSKSSYGSSEALLTVGLKATSCAYVQPSANSSGVGLSGPLSNAAMATHRPT